MDPELVEARKKGLTCAGLGRKPGSTNKFSKLKGAFVEAFYSAELNGTQGLIDWAKQSNENRTNFYKFIVQLLPKDLKITGDENRPVATKVVIEVHDASIAHDEDNTIEGTLITEDQLSNSTVEALVKETIPEKNNDSATR